jgi:hypothetical protein
MNRLFDAQHLERSVPTDDMDLLVQDVILCGLAHLSDAPVPSTHRRELLVTACAEDLALADDAEVWSASALEACRQSAPPAARQFVAIDRACGAVRALPA